LKIDFNKFAELVNEFTQTRRINILKDNKTKFCSEPITNWLGILDTLTAAGSDHLTNQLDLPQMMDLLNERFPVDNFQQNAISSLSKVKIILN